MWVSPMIFVTAEEYRPWKLVSYVAFSREKAVLDFERHLKTGSGRAFINKRLR
jgi:putative endonuclease